MKLWAWVTVGLYALTLAALVLPVGCIAFTSWPDWGTIANADLWPLWVFLGLMVLAQFALLAAPVHLALQRPVRRIRVFWTILAATFATLVLAAGMGLTLGEAASYTWRGDEMLFVTIGVVGLFWVAWGVLFGLSLGKAGDAGLMDRIRRWLLRGSILELLIAIPAHIYARRENECCGGFGTLWGLAAGIAVMLFAFGPSVLFLFTRRLRQIRKPGE